MNLSKESGHVKEYNDLQEASYAASQAAAAEYSRSATGILFRQGGRRFISTSLPVEVLADLIRQPHLPPRRKRGEPQIPTDVRKTGNRPLNKEHRDAIKEYLIHVEHYILPPILLNSDNAITVFPVKNDTTAAQMCVFVIPRGVHLHITDGQHRIAGMLEAMVEKESLKRDAIAVTIVEEPDHDKTLQDFFDASQVKKLPPTMLIEFDGREPVNQLVKDVINEVPLFKERIRRDVNNISVAENTWLFTNSTVKRTVIAMFSAAKTNDPTQASNVINANQERWRKRLVHFFTTFTEANPQWREVASRSPAAGEVADVAGFRQKYLHFTAAGLLLIGGVGQAILWGITPGNNEDYLTPQQETYVQKLARDVDWSRNAQIWKDSGLVVGGLLSDKRGFNALAISFVKRYLGLKVEGKELMNLNKRLGQTPVPGEVLP